MNISENQNLIPGTVLSDLPPTSVTADTTAKGIFNDHEIRRTEPNIDSRSPVIGSDPQLVHDLVSAGLKDNPTEQEATEHQVDQITPRTENSICSDSAPQTTSRTGLFRALEEVALPPLFSDFSKDDLEKQQEQVQKKYTEAFNDLKAFSPEIAASMTDEPLASIEEKVEEEDTETASDLNTFSSEIAASMVQEPLPQTEKEFQDFETKYERFMQTNPAENAERLIQLEKCITQTYGLNAAMNVLDTAIEYQQNFVNRDANNLEETVHKLQGAAVGILKMTEIIMTIATYSVNGGDSNHFNHDIDSAYFYAHESISANTQYAEAIKAKDPQTAERLVRAAALFSQSVTCYINAAKERLSNNQSEVMRWQDEASNLSSRATVLVKGENDHAN